MWVFPAHRYYFEMKFTETSLKRNEAQSARAESAHGRGGGGGRRGGEGGGGRGGGMWAGKRG